MESAQKCFISSTFWTERIGPTAALATLKTMKEKKSWDIINKNGNYIIKNWKKLSMNINYQSRFLVYRQFVLSILN